MKKNKKKKKGIFDKKKPTQRIKKAERKPRAVASPYNVIIRNWEDPLAKHEKKALNENSKLEFQINGDLYVVSIDKVNNCLQFSTHEKNLLLQPVSVHQFLVKAYTPKAKTSNESKKTE